MGGSSADRVWAVALVVTIAVNTRTSEDRAARHRSAEESIALGI